MRMFMTGFSDAVTVRFGALDLVRGDWRRYTNTHPYDTHTDKQTNRLCYISNIIFNGLIN